MPIAEGVSQSKWMWFKEAREMADIERFDTASRRPGGSLRLLFFRASSFDMPYLSHCVVSSMV